MTHNPSTSGSSVLKDPGHTDTGMRSPVSRLSLLGAKVDTFRSYDDALRHIDECVRLRRKTFCVAINPEKVDAARKSPELRQILRRADMGICDGIGIVLASMILYGKRIHRCTGCDLFTRLIEHAAAVGHGIFLLGASPEVNKAACENLKLRFPGLRIVGARDGYFSDDADVVEAINASGADLLFVAMGSPRQEYWLTANGERLDVPFRMGIGGSLDVISGKVRRAPWLFRKTGTEFLYRLLSNPSRWRRQLALPRFIGSVFREKLSGRTLGGSTENPGDS